MVNSIRIRILEHEAAIKKLTDVTPLHHSLFNRVIARHYREIKQLRTELSEYENRQATEED